MVFDLWSLTFDFLINDLNIFVKTTVRIKEFSSKDQKSKVKDQNFDSILWEKNG